jgi:hypothetical protein
MNKTLYIFLSFFLISCGDCSDTKTGIGTSSRSLKESIQNKVFQFEMTCSKKVFYLDSGSTFKIKDVWIESDWKYECIKNKLTVIKNDLQQLVIDGEFNGRIPQSRYHYVLWVENGSHGGVLGSRLSFIYSNEKKVILNLRMEKKTIDSITFYKD